MSPPDYLSCTLFELTSRYAPWNERGREEPERAEGSFRAAPVLRRRTESRRLKIELQAPSGLIEGKNDDQAATLDRSREDVGVVAMPWRLTPDPDPTRQQGCDTCHAVRQLYWLTTSEWTLHLCLVCSDHAISRLEAGDQPLF